MTRLDVGWLEATLTKTKTERDWWRAIADELAEALESCRSGWLPLEPPAEAALRRYEARRGR